MKKIFTGVIAFLLAAVLAAGVCCMGYASRNADGKWFGNFKNISEWHWADSVDPWQTVAISEDGEAMLAGEKYDMPAALAFITAESDEQVVSDYGITVSVSLSNEYINGAYEWTWEFENPSSSWASKHNVEDCIELTASEKYANTANIKALIPFGEPIIVKAQLVGYDEAFATCKVDYIKRVNHLWELTLGPNDFPDGIVFDCEVEYGEGTIKGDLKFTSAGINPVSGFLLDLKDYLKFDIGFKAITFDLSSASVDEYDTDCFEIDIAQGLEYSMFIKDFDNFSDAQKDAVYYAWNQAYKERGRNTNAMVSLTVNYTYNGATINTISETDMPGSNITGDCFGSELTPDVLLNNSNVAL